MEVAGASSRFTAKCLNAIQSLEIQLMSLLNLDLMVVERQSLHTLVSLVEDVQDAAVGL